LPDPQKLTLKPGKKEKRKISLSGLILIAFLLGVGAGLFFGESAAVLQIMGRVFFQLLQMTILPYITFSLIANLGALSPATAKAITARTGWVLSLSWVLVLFLVLAGSFALPELESASFFSTSDVTPPESVDLLGLFIPSNPFRALSNNFVPAVVLFSIALGVALMGIGGKEPVLDQLQVIAKALARISGTVAKLTPLGVFGVTASAAGTLTLEDLGRIEAYLILLVGMALLLVFWIFPMVLSLLTGFRYRDILGRLSDALIVAFSADSLFIALPLISEAAACLVKGSQQEGHEETQSFDVVLPVIFSFPHAGKLLLLLFLVFAAWFSGSPLAAAKFPTFALAGLFSLFGSSSAAILFLLDFLRIPTDLFQLNLVTSLVTGRIASACGVMHLFAVALLSTAALKWTHARSNQLLRLMVGSSVLLFLFLAGTHAYLRSKLSGVYEKDKVITGMKPILATAPAVVHREGIANPRDGGERRSLEAIRSAGVLRAGYYRDALPFGYFNSAGDLVGLDVEVAHLLARELGARLEFFPISLETVASQLSQHQIDIAFASIPGNTELFAKVRLVEPHLEVRLGLVVPDHRREEFESVDAIRRMKDVRVGVSAGTYFADKLREAFPNLQVVTLGSTREFFEKKNADVLLTSAEGGSAWTLLYPAYTVVVPTPSKVFQPLSYAVARDNAELGEFLDHWVRLKKADGTIDRLRDHWILGKGAGIHSTRWSVLRNVLRWKR
jgi:Na+/H+-dicarboxylate symporter/ABC-type amino acid transport substrate-binding protein